MSNKHGWGGVVYDHLVRTLKNPVARTIFNLDGERISIQILEFDRVFAQCKTFSTIGFGMCFSSPDEFMELIVVVDWGGQYIPDILSDAALYLMDQDHPPYAGMSMGVVSQSSPEFSKATGKTALYFTSPFPFPDDFKVISDGRRSGRILLVTFISQSEHEFLKENGADALEDKLVEAEADVFAVKRASVV